MSITSRDVLVQTLRRWGASLRTPAISFGLSRLKVRNMLSCYHMTQLGGTKRYPTRVYKQYKVLLNKYRGTTKSSGT
jgi:hypothetical protein